MCIYIYIYCKNDTRTLQCQVKNNEYVVYVSSTDIWCRNLHNKTQNVTINTNCRCKPFYFILGLNLSLISSDIWEIINILMVTMGKEVPVVNVIDLLC